MTADDVLRSLLGQALGIAPEAIVSSDLMLADSLPARREGTRWRAGVCPRLDNLGMCHAALQSLLRSATADTPDVPLIALFDHEVGSGSAYGAEAPILPTIIERIVAATGSVATDRRERYLRALASCSACQRIWRTPCIPTTPIGMSHTTDRVSTAARSSSTTPSSYATCGRTQRYLPISASGPGCRCSTTFTAPTCLRQHHRPHHLDPAGHPHRRCRQPDAEYALGPRVCSARDPELMVRALACFLASRDELPG